MMDMTWCELCECYKPKKHQCKNSYKVNKSTTYKKKGKIKIAINNCINCDKEFDVYNYNSTKKFCSIECRDKYHIKTDATIGRFLILERDLFACVYCGARSIDGIKLHADHIYPKSLGGLDIAGNLVTACCDCNVEKSNKVMSDEALDLIFSIVKKRNEDNDIDDEMLIKLPGV